MKAVNVQYFRDHFAALVSAYLLSLSCTSTHMFKTSSSLQPMSKSNQSETPKVATQTPKISKPAFPSALEQANQYAKDGLYREAISAFKKYLAEQPKDPAALRTLGIIYVKSGSYKSGIAALIEALPSFKEDFELNYYLAEAYRTQNKFSDAIFHYKQALLANPNNLASYKALTWSYYSIRYYAEALKCSKELKKMAPDDFQVSIIQARIMSKIGMNDKALLVLNRSEALASPNELPFLYSAKGDILLELGELDRAEQFFRKALQDQPLLPGALTGLAKVLSKDSRNHDQVVSYLERALRIKPNHVEAMYLLAQVYEGKDESKSSDFYRKFSKEANFDPAFQKELNVAKNYLHKRDKTGNDVDELDAKIEDLEDQL